MRVFLIFVNWGSMTRGLKSTDVHNGNLQLTKPLVESWAGHGLDMAARDSSFGARGKVRPIRKLASRSSPALVCGLSHSQSLTYFGVSAPIELRRKVCLKHLGTDV